MQEILIQFEAKELSEGLVLPEVIIQAHNLRNDQVAGVLGYAYVNAAKRFIAEHRPDCRCPALELAEANVAAYTENFTRTAPKKL